MITYNYGSLKTYSFIDDEPYFLRVVIFHNSCRGELYPNLSRLVSHTYSVKNPYCNPKYLAKLE